jgi:hypothetical protein
MPTAVASILSVYYRNGDALADPAVVSRPSTIRPPTSAPWSGSAPFTEDVHPDHLEVLRGLEHVAVVRVDLLFSRSAEKTFKESSGRFGGWKELIDAGLLGKSLAEGLEYGHRFEIRANEKTYESVAVPVEKNDKLAYVGWSFYLDESGVIRGTACGKADGYAVAGKNDPPVRWQ